MTDTQPAGIPAPKSGLEPRVESLNLPAPDLNPSGVAPAAAGPHPPLDDQLCADPDCGCCYPGGLEEAQPTGEEVIRYAALIADIIAPSPRAVTQAVIHGMLQDGWERPPAAGPHPDTPDLAGDEELDLAPIEARARPGTAYGSLGQLAASADDVPALLAEVRRLRRLVSPAASRVLDALREWRLLTRAGAHPGAAGHWLSAAAAAVDALDGDQPAEPYPREQYEAVAEHARQQLHASATNQTGLLAGVDVGARNRALRDALQEDAEVDALQRDEEDAEPAPEPLTVDPAWAGSCLCEDREAHDPDCRQGHGPECDSGCWSATGCPQRHRHDPEPAPGPDSGPGWDRARIELIADAIEKSVRLNCECWHSADTAGQLRALLADRDRQAQAAANLFALAERRFAALERVSADLEAARAELAEMEQLFDLQLRRTGAATALWRAEAPQERALIQPDLGALLAWLMARSDAARAELAEVTAERNRLRGEVDEAWQAAGDMAAIEEAAAKDRAEVERLRGELETKSVVHQCCVDAEALRAELATARREIDDYVDWSNSLTEHIPDRYDGDLAQEEIISHWIADMMAERERLTAESATARRDAAAEERSRISAAIQRGADSRAEFFTSDLPGMAAARAWREAIQIAGARPVPGSPQPADGGGDDAE